jgi:thiol-disulfide isomerase/thioredoxin
MNGKWIIALAGAAAIALLSAPMLLNRRHVEAPVATNAAGCPVTKGTGLTVKDMSGCTVSIADYTGKVVVLNFWATWCGPCKIEIPDLIKANAAYKDKGVVILGISIDDTAEELKAFSSEFKIDYPVLMMNDALDTAYGPIPGVPVTIFLDRDGKEIKRHFGPLSMEQFEKEVKEVL